MERLASRWLLAATLALLASHAHAQAGETPPTGPAPAETAPEAVTATQPATVDGAPQEAVDSAPPEGTPSPAATPTSSPEPVPATSSPEPVPAAVPEPTPATTPSRPAATETAPAQGAPASAAPAVRASDADYAAEAEASDEGYQADSYEEPADDSMDDPMDSGLSLRAGAEFQGARRFGSLTRDVLGSDAIRQGIVDQTGQNIDPNAYIPTMEDFVLPSSTDFQLAVGLNLGGLIFYRLEGIATFGTLTSLGAFNGLGLCLHFGPVYLSIAIGGRVSWLMHRELEGGVSLAGRVPVDLTAYLAPDFALFLQGGMGWGLDIVKVNNVDDLATANTATFDISGGIRFP